ncbi:MAG: F0F1 ATP synthase subunit B [Planctomycetota bacterium]
MSGRWLRSARWSTCGWVLVLHDVAVAAEHESSPGLFTGDLGNIIWTLLTFAAVVVVLGKYAWGPILQGLRTREEFIRVSLDQAKKDHEKAEARLKEYVAQLDRARDETEAIVAEGRRDAEVVRLKIKEQAQNEADAILERAKREIAIARNTAIKEIYEVGAQLATGAAAKILGRELNTRDHERLITESIEELASQRN